MIFASIDKSAIDKNSAFDHHEAISRYLIGSARDTVAIIAIHNTNLGPALGGCRIYPYANEEAALTDVLRLSRGMTYKNAMAGLPLGGGKAVIIGNPRLIKSPELMEDMGDAVAHCGGRYVTAEDSGTTEEDMVAVARRTQYVTGLPSEHLSGKGFGELGGNPSPLTALGVYHGIRAAVQHKYGGASLGGLKVAVQGVGAVGLSLCQLLAQDGAELFITDLDQVRLAQALSSLETAHPVAADDIYEIEADVFSPCAMGGILNDTTVPKIKASIIAGAANNQLLSSSHDLALAERNILYVPDYVINAGGVICVGYEYFRKSGYNPLDFDISRETMVAHVERIGRTVCEVLTHAKEDRQSTGAAADALAEARFMGLSTSEPPASSGRCGGTTLVQ